MKRKNQTISRREFFKNSSMGLVTASALPFILQCSKNPEVSALEPEVNEDEKRKIYEDDGNDPVPPDPQPKEEQLETRTLGKTGMKVSRLSFGGGSQFMNNNDGEWEPIMELALAVGVNYFDTAWNYGDGKSERRFGEILNNHRNSVYVATKLDARESEESKQQFAGCLDRLNMDYVDVLMMHAISQYDVLSTIENGVYKELVKFKDEGTAKFIGFSVMEEEDLPMAKSIIENLDVDVILGIINPVGRFGNCADLLSIVNEKNIGFLAMKTLRNMVNQDTTAKELIAYALDKEGVTGAVIGHYGLQDLEENIEIVKEYTKVSCLRKDWGALEKRVELFSETHTPVWTLPGYRDGMMV